MHLPRQLVPRLLETSCVVAQSRLSASTLLVSPLVSIIGVPTQWNGRRCHCEFGRGYAGSGRLYSETTPASWGMPPCLPCIDISQDTRPVCLTSHQLYGCHALLLMSVLISGPGCGHVQLLWMWSMPPCLSCIKQINSIIVCLCSCVCSKRG